jgi:hypothetical protein
LAGLKGYVTKLPDVDARFVIDAYHRLFQIERSFRMSKHDLRARPIYRHKRASIEAHLTIVFAALAVSRWIEDRTGWSIKKFVRTTRRYRTIQIQAGEHTLTGPPTPCPATCAMRSRPSTRHQMRTNLIRVRFHGGDRHLRRDLQAQGVGYVLAVAKNHHVTACAPVGPTRADQIAAELPARSWNRLSAGDGSKGWRDYDWAWVRLVAPETEADAGGHHCLLVRRSCTTGELAFYRCWSPRPVPLRTRASRPADPRARNHPHKCHGVHLLSVAGTGSGSQDFRRSGVGPALARRDPCPASDDKNDKRAHSGYGRSGLYIPQTRGQPFVPSVSVRARRSECRHGSTAKPKRSAAKDREE